MIFPFLRTRGTRGGAGAAAGWGTVGAGAGGWGVA